MTTLTTFLTRVREQLDEPIARFWTDANLTTWINDALKDIARKTESIQSYNTSVSAVVGTNKYSFPTDLIRVHRIEFVPTGSTITYTLEPKTQDEMDRVWGGFQSSSGYPQYYMIWGYPGGSSTMEHKFQVYPVPSATGTFNLYYYRIPTDLTSGSDVAQIPNGWDDLVVYYVCYRALQKRMSPNWQEYKLQYDEQVMYMIDATRSWHDQNSSIVVGGRAIPSWLYGGDDY